MIMEGALKKIWSFADPQQGDRALRDYIKRRDG